MSDQTRDLNSIFLAALEIESPDERAAFILRSCGDDLNLRRELEEMLVSHDAAGSFLEQPAPGLDRTVVGPLADEARAALLDAGLALSLGREAAVVLGDANHSVLKMLSNTLNKVPHVSLRESEAEGAGPISRPDSSEIPHSDADGRYRLDGEIARGGMGAIIKGRDTDLGRDLAIKVLLDSHKDKPDVVQRFIEEAQIGGQLQHPGIAPIYELGQFADKRPFFAMKLVKGQTLSKLLADRDHASEERGRFLGIFEQTCQTMAYAHSRGVIHRDLKPANIMVGAFGEVQVMDWGLAKVLKFGGVADEKKSNTQQGQSIIQTLRSGVGSDAEATGSHGSAGSETLMGSVMGTPAYMPPEQALGEIDQMDERADVFGLGAILCEILTGKPPYVADKGAGVFRMASHGMLKECIERLDACGADEDLIALTKHCLELEPADRPRDAGALAQRVAGYVESVESKLREAEVDRAAEAARADAEAAQAAAERQRAEAEIAKTEAERQRAQAEYDRAETEAKRLAQQQRHARKLKRTLAGLAALALLAVGASIIAGNYWRIAERARSVAEDARAEAVETRESALRARYIADMNHAGAEASAGNFGLTLELLKRHVPKEGQEDLRGLEWYLMWKRIQSGVLAETVPLPIDVTSLSISPDQKIAAVAGWTRGIYLVDMEARTEPLVTIPAARFPVQFLPNGRFVAAVGVVKPTTVSGTPTWKIELWDAKRILNGTQSVPAASFPLEHAPHDIAVSADGQFIASCSRSSAQINVWKRTGPNLQSVDFKKLPSISLPGYKSRGIEQVSFALDGRTLVYSRRNTLGVLKLPVGDWDSRISIQQEELLRTDVSNSFAVTPDGTKLAYSRHNQVVVWDLVTERSLHNVDTNNEVRGLRWSEDGEFLMTSQDDNSVLVWNFLHRTRHRLWGHSRRVRGAAIIQHDGADSPCLITVNQERQLRYWQLDEAHGLALDAVLDCVAAATARNRSDTVLAFKGGSIERWELGTSDRPIELYQHSGEVHQLAYSPQGTIASISAQELRLWNPATQKSFVLDRNPGEGSIRFSQDGGKLASFHGDRIKLWDVAQGRLTRSLRHGSIDGIDGGVFLAGTTQILSDSEVGNNQLCVWDYGVPESYSTLKRRFAIDDFIWGGTGFTVDPRTDRVAIASSLGIRVLDPARLESIHIWKSHGDHVDSVTYASQSNTLASSGRDGLVRLWDAKTVQPKMSLTAPRGHSIDGLAFVGDDSALFLVENGMLRIWQIAREVDVKAAGW